MQHEHKMYGNELQLGSVGYFKYFMYMNTLQYISIPNKTNNMINEDALSPFNIHSISTDFLQTTTFFFLWFLFCNGKNLFIFHFKKKIKKKCSKNFIELMNATHFDGTV